MLYSLCFRTVTHLLLSNLKIIKQQYNFLKIERKAFQDPRFNLPLNANEHIQHSKYQHTFSFYFT